MDLFMRSTRSAAAEMAMKESGLPVGKDKPHGYVPERVGVIIGSGIGGLGSLEEQHKKALREGLRPPLAVLHPPDDHQHGARAGDRSSTGARARTGRRCRRARPARTRSARRVKSIRSGETDAMIAGGSEATITPLGIGGFAAMRALSTRNDDPAARQPPVRQGPRRLRRWARARASWCSRSWSTPRRRGAKILRRGRRLRRERRRAPRDRTGAGGRGRRALHAAWRSRTRGCTPEDVGLHQRARHLDALNDANETHGDQEGVRRRTRASWRSARPSR